MKEVIVYSLWLLIVPDIESSEVKLKRLEFTSHASCLVMANLLEQKRDPIVQKKQCRRVIKYPTDQDNNNK
jgi:hypothetical protein